MLEVGTLNSRQLAHNFRDKQHCYNGGLGKFAKKKEIYGCLKKSTFGGYTDTVTIR